MAFEVGMRVKATDVRRRRGFRLGVVEQVLRGDPKPKYRIRWDGGQQSIYTPESGHGLLADRQPISTRGAAQGQLDSAAAPLRARRPRRVGKARARPPQARDVDPLEAVDENPLQESTTAPVEEKNLYRVRGTVCGRAGQPVAGVRIAVSLKRLRSEDELEVGVTDAGGSYDLAYQAPGGQTGDARALIVVRAGPSPEVPEQEFVAMEAGPDLTVNFGGGKNVRSEFQRHLVAVLPWLDGAAVSELAEDERHHDLSYLAPRTGLSWPSLLQIAAAHRLEALYKDDEIPAAAFYAFLRQGIPASVSGQFFPGRSTLTDAILWSAGTAIAALSPSAQTDVLTRAASKNLVPQTVADDVEQLVTQLQRRRVEDELNLPFMSGSTPLREFLSAAGLAAERYQGFVEAWVSARTPEEFWANVGHPGHGLDADEAASVRRVLELGALTGYHMPLVQALQQGFAQDRYRTAGDLAYLTPEDWTNLVIDSSQGEEQVYPSAVEGATDQERAAALATHVFQRVSNAHPTLAFAARLASDPMPAFDAADKVREFIGASGDFDLLTTNIDAHANTHPDLITGDLRSSLMAAQRLAKLNSNYDVMSALMGDGVHSAQQVYSMGRDRFVAKYGSLPALGAPGAARMFAKAEQTYGVALALATRVNATLGAANPAAVGGGFPADVAQQLAAYPNLQTLFGSESWCACRDCESVLGAPAYLADMLQFLKHRSASGGRSVGDVLLERRPDIAQIELSCPNTNTTLPYIDLVNELLEDAVAPSAAAVTPAPPASRNRQTTLTTAELNANPQYVNVEAYVKLAGAVFPWTLPFDLPLSEARAYLGQLGLDRSSLIRTFQKPRGYPSSQAREIAVETLGMTAVEADIVTGGPLAAGHQSWEYWGLQQLGNTIADPDDPSKTVSGSWIEVLSQARVLLARAGLTYQELARLLNTIVINGAGTVTIVCDPPDSCDVAKMTVQGLTQRSRPPPPVRAAVAALGLARL